MTTTPEKPKPRTAGGKPYQRSSDGMWCAQIELPSPDPTKRRRKVIVRAKKADVIRARRDALRDLERAGDLATASPTVAQWCDLWWRRYGMKRLKVSTRGTYQSKIEQYIKPALGRIRLEQLSVEHVYRLHDYIIETKELAPSNALGAHRVLSVMISDAEKEGRVARNVVKLADKPRAGKKKVEYLDNAQARQLLLAVADSPDDAARWTTALLTGMRQAERLGMTIDELDFENDTITVAWQLRRLPFEHGCGARTSAGEWPCDRKRGGNCPQRHLDIPADQEVQHVEGGLYLTRPKSAAGWRTVPMVGLLRETLLRHTETNAPGKAGLVFTRTGVAAGRPIDPADDSEAWGKALAVAGLPPVKGHSARHTCNTILTELRVPVDVRRQILGHASNAINEAVYTHTSDVRVAEAMRQLDAAMDWRALASDQS